MKSLFGLSAETVIATIAGCHRADPNFVGADIPITVGEARVFFAACVVAAAQFTVWTLDDNCGVASAAVDF